MPTTLLASATATVTTVPDVSVGHALVQMVLALAVIVGSIVVLTKILARLRSGSTRTAKRHATTGLTVLSRQSLGKDLSIAAVKWGGREVLVGISGSTITFLNDARADEAAAGGALSDEVAPEQPAAPARRAFSPAVLAAAAAGRAGRGAAEPAREAARVSLLETLRDATARR